MRQLHSMVRRSPEVTVDLYQDETLAMVYVGDVYSLVAQNGTAGEPIAPSTEVAVEQRAEPQDDTDTLLPFIR